MLNGQNCKGINEIDDMDIFERLLAYHTDGFQNHQYSLQLKRSDHSIQENKKFVKLQSEQKAKTENIFQKNCSSMENMTHQIYNIHMEKKQTIIQKKYSQGAKTNAQLANKILNYESIHFHQTTNNVPKFLLKMAKQYFTYDYIDMIHTVKFPQRFQYFFKKVVKRARCSNLKMLYKFLNMKLFDKTDQLINRKIRWHILRKRKKQAIITNKKIIKKSLYSISTKVYRLRCRNSSLVKRTSLK